MPADPPYRRPEALTPRERQDRTTVDGAFDHATVRILLLEDSQIDFELIRERLARILASFEITRVVLREDFEAAVDSGRFDIILSDYSLPSFDGMAALEIARSKAPELPFIVVSGVLGEEFAIEALKKGATDYVLKQRMTRLPAAVRRALSEAYERKERKAAEARLLETMEALRHSEEETRRLNETLERRVEERTRELQDQIVEREKVEHTLRQMQRMEAVGQLTSGVAHDFNNLLTVILGNIDLLQMGIDEPKLRRRLEHVREAAERGSKLTAQLLAFSRRQRLEPKPLDLNQAVGGMSDLLRSTMGGSVRVETILKPGLWPALADPTQIEMAVLNLAINARDAMQVGGALTVETGNVVLEAEPERPEQPGPGDYVMIAVTDSGPGIEPQVLDKVFEPFFTTKGVGKGSGLGLSQVLGFAKQSGGGVTIESHPGEGASVKIYLPRAALGAVPAAEPEPREHEPRAQPIGGRMPELLLVDDDSAVREVTCAKLRQLGYGVTEAGSARQALDILAGHPPFDMMLIDYAMPGMNGGELAKRVRESRPEEKILFITGYADFAALAAVSDDRVVHKPFRDGELARQVAATLGYGEAPSKVVPLKR